jgi:hypothetical protein
MVENKVQISFTSLKNVADTTPIFAKLTLIQWDLTKIGQDFGK